MVVKDLTGPLKIRGLPIMIDIFSGCKDILSLFDKNDQQNVT